MTSVLIVDDHSMVLQGCRRVLADMGIEHVYEATTVVSGYRAFLRHHPDVVIADLTFQGDDLGGLSLIRRIASSDRKARILVLSMHNDPAIVSRALESGALSYVLKDMSSSEFSTAFEKVQLGEPHLSHRLAMQVAMLRAKGDELGDEGSHQPRGADPVASGQRQQLRQDRGEAGNQLQDGDECMLFNTGKVEDQYARRVDPLRDL